MATVDNSRIRDMVNSRFDRSVGTMRSLFDFSHLEPQVQSHLQRVYTCLAMGLLFAAVGAYIGIYIQLMYGLIAALIGLGLVIYLRVSRDDFGFIRHAVFIAFCVLAGSGLSPLIALGLDSDPSILFHVIIVTLVVTACFSGVALIARRSRLMIFLAGPLAAGLIMLLVVRIINQLFRSQLTLGLMQKITLFVFSGFIVFDTQKIVELVRIGEYDYIIHCMDLFLDIRDVFRALLGLLTLIKSVGRSRGVSRSA